MYAYRGSWRQAATAAQLKGVLHVNFYLFVSVFVSECRTEMVGYRPVAWRPGNLMLWHIYRCKRVTRKNQMFISPKIRTSKGENPGKGAGTHQPTTGLDSTQDDSHYEQINEPVVHLGGFVHSFSVDHCLRWTVGINRSVENRMTGSLRNSHLIPTKMRPPVPVRRQILVTFQWNCIPFLCFERFI